MVWCQLPDCFDLEICGLFAQRENIIHQEVNKRRDRRSLVFLDRQAKTRDSGLRSRELHQPERADLSGAGRRRATYLSSCVRTEVQCVLESYVMNPRR